MTIISPSLLACDFLNIERELAAFKNLKNIWFHLDIMDGHFVPNLTFGHAIIAMIEKKTSIALDAHLMVDNPAFYIDTFKHFNLENFTFHYEAAANPLDLIAQAKKHFKGVGLSIKPETPVEVLTPAILGELDLVLVMSVNPGFGGQKFIERAYGKVKVLAQWRQSENYRYQIQVDGGINSGNAAKLIACGADNLVAGSSIFKAGPSQYPDMIESLRRGGP